MREILEADILFLSLCPRGKNGFVTIYKADTSHVEFSGLTKALDGFDEKGRLAAVVWVPNRRDADGDFASAATVEKMAHSFLKNGAQLDMIHDCKSLPKEAVFVAESFIIQKGDERFSGVTDYAGAPVDPTGGWGVILQINDPNLRKAYREGEWEGVSMYGPGKVRHVEAIDKARVEAIRKVITTKETEDMTKEEIDALVAKSVADALLAKQKADEDAAKLAKAKADEDAAKLAKEKADEDAAKLVKAPEIDVTNPEAVREHAKKLAIVELQKGVNWSDPKSVEEYASKLETLQKGETSEVKKAAASKAGEGETDTREVSLVKSGVSFAKAINARRGF